MGKTIITEGKTSTEAIEKGLKQLKVSRDKVDIKILETEQKRSFFNILTPRVVKVEMTLKNEIQEKVVKEDEKQQFNNKEKKLILTIDDLEKAKSNLNMFLGDFISKLDNMQYKITSDNEYIYITLTGDSAGKLIGYRGETLNSMQSILNVIANKQLESKVHVILDIGDYRKKRKKALEELADKLTRTVINTGKQVVLEPMSAYERKIIHNRLQDSKRVKTYSTGEEPYRKVVIVKK